MKRNILHIAFLFTALLVVNNVWGENLPNNGTLVAGKTYNLTNNHTLTGTLTIPKGNIIINLKGYTLNGNSQQIFNVNEGGVLTINGTGIINNGNAVNGGCAVISGAVIINDVTIQNCVATNDGGVFYVNKNGKLTINNGELKNNSANRLGGAICSATTSNDLIINGKTNFNRNIAKHSGGAIYARTLKIKGSSNDNPIIFEYNEATSLGTEDPTFTPKDKGGYNHNNTGTGGGICIAQVNNNDDPFGSMKCEIEYCKIQYNHAAVNGGGIYSGVHTTIKNSKILDNTAMSSEKRDYPIAINYGRGGGFYFSGYYHKDNGVLNQTQCYLENTEVIGNAAMYYGGGGQLTTRATLTFVNSKINDNTAVLHGAGGLHLTSDVTFNFTSGEINNNVAYTVGGGIHTSYGCTLNLNGGIIQGNMANQRGGGVHVNTGGSLVLNGTDIIDNKVYKGKDMAYATVIKETDGTYTWDENSLDYKKTTESSYKYEDNDDTKFLVNTGLGGGVLIDSGTCTMNTGKLSQNYAEEAGGGLCLVMIRMSDSVDDFNRLNVVKFEMNSGEINNNRSKGNGAGVYIMKNKIPEMLTELFKTMSQENKDKITGSSKYNLLTTGKPSTIIEEGIFNENIAELSGGAIYMEEGSFTVKNNASMEKNGAKLSGGAIYIGNGSVTVNGTGTISATNNEVKNGNGGGIYCKGAFSINGTATISNNKAVNGGGICVENGSVTIAKDKNSEIKNNIATNYGGGLYVVNEHTSYTTASFNGGTFFQNNAKAGGAVCASGKINLSLGANMEENTANLGGGIYMEKGVIMTFNDGIIRKNEAVSDLTVFSTAYQKDAANVSGVGGGIFMAQNTQLSFTNPDQLGIYNNAADNAGADICANGDNTEIQLPNTSNMDLTGFEIPGNELYWVEDYNNDEINYSNALNTVGDQHVRYEDVLKNSKLKINRVWFDNGTKSKKITQYACLDLGYDVVFVNLKYTLPITDYSKIRVSYYKNGTEASPTSFVMVLLTGEGDKEVTKELALPSGEWIFEPTDWQTEKYKAPTFDPVIASNKILIKREGLYNPNNETTPLKGDNKDIKVLFAEIDHPAKNLIESHRNIVNYMVP